MVGRAGWRGVHEKYWGHPEGMTICYLINNPKTVAIWKTEVLFFEVTVNINVFMWTQSVLTQWFINSHHRGNTSLPRLGNAWGMPFSPSKHRRKCINFIVYLRTWLINNTQLRIFCLRVFGKNEKALQTFQARAGKKWNPSLKIDATFSHVNTTHFCKKKGRNGEAKEMCGRQES